ncbi:CHASE2 domain-containing protein [Pseudooceanicola aestuarii]|uniref:CHASE2 domain-containing protein n=1 Tax=Pseudooceanicola aestuarii TaxID=2697319 RepID=UPI0013D73C33|nr:adenylate/guanylate cyclase domain-containing protein [Pseudooceanicola aestuarii]
MLGRFLKRYAARLVGLALLLALLALRVVDPLPVQTLRNLSFDAYQRWHPRPVPDLPVAILDIDDASIEELGQWPWPRTRLADLIDAATAAGAVAVAFDIVFAEPDRLSPGAIARDNPALPADTAAALTALPSNDDVLAEAIGRSRVVLGQTSLRSATANRAEKRQVRPAPHAILGADPAPFLLKFPDIVANLDRLEDRAAGRGVFSVLPDADGIYRRVPVVMQVQDQLRLGLSMELLRIATGGQAFALRSNEAGIDGIVVARQLIRTAPDGTVWPWFSPTSDRRFVPAADLLNGRMAPGRLAGHLVLVGTSAIGLQDFRPTPLGRPMAGVEIHAQLLENVLQKTLLVRPNYAVAVEIVMLLALGAIVIGLTPLLQARWLIALTLLLVAGYGGVSFWQFQSQRLLLDPTFPMLGTVLTVMLMASANYLREEARREQIRGAFGQYVSPRLVEQLQADPQGLRLGGETRQITLLFSDIRGFTTISEAYKDDPQGLTRLMNRFLTEQSNAILDQDGTIDKFMGDAVMAFWNAPMDCPDHQAAACRAALDMLDRVARLNTHLAEEAARDGTATPHRIDIGVGLNSGLCTVGNMGSDLRFDYTAMGDAVNLASRLEGQTKSYGMKVVIGATTNAAVSDRFATLELDLIRVKGKTEPERIFALLGGADLAVTPGFSRVQKENRTLLEAYRNHDWTSAEKAADRLEQAAADAGLGLEGYVAMYRDRLDTLRLTPPAPDWDGAYDALTK